MTFWAAALRAAVSVAVGLLFALGIARLNSVICLCWFALTLLMFSVELCLSVWRFVSSPAGVHWVGPGSGLPVMALLWLLTSAEWRPGHTSANNGARLARRVDGLRALEGSWQV